MSATIEGRSDGADILLRAITGDVVARETEETLMRDGWIAVPDVYMVYTPASHDSMYEWDMVYQEGIVDNEERNERIVDATIHLIKSGKLVLVLCNYIAHGMKLMEQINKAMPSQLPKVSFIHGSTPKSIRDGELKRFKEASSLCLIGSNILDEGVDVPACDSVIITSAGKSRIKVLQRVGRALRPSKSGKAVVVDFYDKDGGMLQKHSISRKRAYRERKFKVTTLSIAEFLGRSYESKG